MEYVWSSPSNLAMNQLLVGCSTEWLLLVLVFHIDGRKLDRIHYTMIEFISRTPLFPHSSEIDPKKSHVTPGQPFCKFHNNSTCFLVVRVNRALHACTRISF